MLRRRCARFLQARTTYNIYIYIYIYNTRALAAIRTAAIQCSCDCVSQYRPQSTASTPRPSKAVLTSVGRTLSLVVAATLRVGSAKYKQPTAHAALERRHPMHDLPRMDGQTSSGSRWLNKPAVRGVHEPPALVLGLIIELHLHGPLRHVRVEVDALAHRAPAAAPTGIGCSYSFRICC
jgi:hypothetical protein